MIEAIPSGFQLVGPATCASCKFLMQYPNSVEFYCSNEKHCFTLGLAPALEHYKCDDHKPPIGCFDPTTGEVISDGAE